MASTDQRRVAEKIYDSGHALFLQGLYNEALIELNRAEDAFRKLDARGHPFSNPLSNGISGLANSLVLSGRCCQELGDYASAITYYETSLINAKFESKNAFRAFLEQLSEDLELCYEKIAQDISLMDHETEIEISFRFPFSLPPDAVPFARLYELSPKRYAHYKNFYDRVRRKDNQIRRQSKTSDESIMKRMSIYVWSILFIIWAFYGIIVIDSLICTKK